MRADTFRLDAADGLALRVHRWLLDEGNPRAVVQIVHGLAEHAARYGRLAGALTQNGYGVYAHDQRGHGGSLRRPDDLGLLAERDGWRLALDDLHRVNRRIAGDWPATPIVLLGHSMGSFMVQQYLYEHPETIVGAVLSASDGAPPPTARLGALAAKAERARLGPRGASKLINSLSFDAFNKQFRPNRTGFDWLSRDPAEVDKYVADPLCGFNAPVQTWVDLLSALPEIARPANQARIPKHLPVLVIAGSEDPVSRGTKGLAQLLEAYRAAGLTHVSHRFYPGARHELFNETNRNEVTADLLAWLERVLAPR